MKKLLLLVFVLNFSACGGKNTSGSRQNVNIPNHPSLQNIPPNCRVWTDGCNTCQIQNGQVVSCTNNNCSNTAPATCNP